MAGGLGSALNSAVAGLQAQTGVVGSAATNLANVTTPGYKRTVATLTLGGVSIPEVFLRRDHSQGAVVPTGNPRDLAIAGSGYFQLTLSNGGTGYTRNGGFGVSAAGVMVDVDGNPVVGPLAINPAGGAPSVAPDGTVTQTIGGLSQVVGRIVTAAFPSPDGLAAISGGLFQEAAPSGAPSAGVPGIGGRGAIVQGALEASNVEPIQEIVGMMIATSAYKASARVVTTVDEMMAELLRKKA